MADRARCDLPYGHFGRGIYSLDDHTWHFERHLAFSSRIQQLAEPKVLSEPLSRSEGTNRGGGRREPLSKRHQNQIKALTDSNSHLLPASNILSPLLRVSEVALDAVRGHDPLKGRLIAFGDISSHSRNRSIPVAAYVTGQTGCDLCITQVQRQKRGWDDDRRSWLEVPALHGEQAIWSSNLGPIQQVHFAANIVSGPALLAVRLLTRTTIIRTEQLKRSSEEATGSSISLNMMYSIHIEKTGDNIHVDVHFNPWFPQQIALIDTAGRWTVLEFSTRSMAHVARTWSNKPDDTHSSTNDGWARIAWIHNQETIAACTRTSLALYSIAEDVPTLIENIELGLSGAVPWVLDFMVLPGRSRDHFCVLTSTHVLVFKVADKTPSRKATDIKFRFRHYKNPDDLSLSLAVWNEDEGDDIGLLVYSSLPGPTSYYQLTISDANSAMIVDQMDISTPAGIHQTGFIVGVEVQCIKLACKPAMSASEPPFRSTRFISAVVAREGFGLCQILLCISGDAVIPPLTWEAKLATSRYKLGRPAFVVEDSSLDLDDVVRERVEPTARRARRAKLQPSPGDQTTSLQRVTALLQSPIEDTEPIVDVLAAIKSELKQPDLDIVSPGRTLYSFVQAELDVRNVEDCSTALEELLQSKHHRTDESSRPVDAVNENGQRLIIAPVEIPLSLGLEDLQLGTDLALVYDRMLATWITPLSESITGRVRLAKARLCGLVAAQLVLASHSLRTEEPFEDQTSPGQAQTQTQSQSQDPHSQLLPEPVQQSSRYRGFALSQLESSQPFPSSALPTPSQTPSITTASSHPSTFAAPELTRLSKYTSFSKPAPPVLPRSLNNVLSHWKVGEDVKDYDWMSTARSIAKQDDDADDGMTEAERRRAQRRAEKHIRRQRREAAASQAQQVASSQAPEIFSASQPMGLRMESQPGGVAASSQFMGPSLGAAAASQVEAGRFGGRPAAATGKKRRRQGF